MIALQNLCQNNYYPRIPQKLCSHNAAHLQENLHKK